MNKKRKTANLITEALWPLAPWPLCPLEPWPLAPSHLALEPLGPWPLAPSHLRVSPLATWRLGPWRCVTIRRGFILHHSKQSKAVWAGNYVIHLHNSFGLFRMMQRKLIKNIGNCMWEYILVPCPLYLVTWPWSLRSWLFALSLNLPQSFPLYVCN